jgi:hypothetical protein
MCDNEHIIKILKKNSNVEEHTGAGSALGNKGLTWLCHSVEAPGDTELNINILLVFYIYFY